MKSVFDTLADVPMIARARLFGNPERGRCTISPCGRWLAFSAPRDGVMNLWVCERDADLASARPLTNDRHRGIDSGNWTIDGQHLLYEQDRDGDEQYHLYAVAVADGNMRDLTPGTDVRAALQGGSRRHPGDVLVMVHERDPRFADLYRIEVATGERRLVQHNTGFDGFVTDDDFRIRLVLQAADDGSLHLLRPAGPDQWTPWITIGRDDAMTTHPMHVDEGGRTLYLLDSRGRDTSAIVSLALEADAPRPVVVASDPRADVAGTIDDVHTHRPLAYVVNVERIERHLLDEQLRPDFEFLDAQGLGDWRPGARSLDDRWWCVHASGDVRLPSTWLYDRHERRVRKLFDAYPQLAGAPLARMQPRTLAARDGLPLVCYLTLPRHADPGDRDWVSRDRVPLVLLVHGGPWARDEWGYHPEHQWLANRGYAVLSVNFRGSTGFGKHFISAGDLEWGGRMDDDIVDAVDHVVALGIADPARIAIMGSSYGGYAVLWGLTNHPDRYACGVDIVGPSNLETLLESLPPHWESARAMLHQQVGDPTTPAGRRLLQERSPLHRADRIRRPLLIGQGANDPRVPQAEADRMVAAMKANHIPVTYVLYPDEGHGFERPANAIAFNAIVERFLARHLGGRFEPATAQEIADHSTVMVEGREDAPL